MKPPKGWEIKSVESLFEVQLGKMLNQAAKTSEEQCPYLTNANVQWGQFRVEQLNTMNFSAAERKKFALKNGDLLVCEGGEVGRCAVWREEVSPCFYQKALHRLRPLNKDEVLPQFMLAYMESIAGTKLLGNLTSQSSIAHLTREKFLELDVLVPPLKEQQGMVLMLGACNKSLELQQRLLAAQVERKRGLVQELLTGKTRFKQFRGEPWRSVRIGALLEECDRYVAWSDDAVYRFASIRRRSGGLFDRGTFYGREVKTKVLKLLKAGDFVISKRQVVHGAWAMVTKAFDGFGVSDEYDVLVNRDPKVLDMRFFDYLSQTRRLAC